jgi:two-component system phosphate regulon sensor histidine kinase PhoR
MDKLTQSDLRALPPAVKAHIVHLERIRRDFIANISHELRTPLTVIRGYLEAAQQAPFDQSKPWDKIFAQMHQQSTRMENIIEDLLLLAKLEDEDQPLELTPQLPISELLTPLRDEAELVSGDKKHHITLTADPTILLDGNEHELKSLFSNLIINAVKYTPPNGSILIEWLSNKKGQAIFRVTDSGIGIAKEHLPRITERFYRVDKARSRNSGGTGLGLAIVKHVLMRHQADLLVESELGKGSCFSCVFSQALTVIKLS